MSQRKAGTILSYVHIILTNTISLIYTPYMLRMMGQSEYGLYGTAASFISYLTLLNFGIGGAYIRFNAIARVSGDRDEERSLNGMFLAIFSILSVLVVIGGIVLSAVTGIALKTSFSPDELYKLRVIMLILTANMAVTFICNVFMMALQAYEKFVCIKLVMIIAGILQPILNVLAISRGGRAIAVTTISLMVSIATYSVFYIYARHAINFEVSFRGFKSEVMKKIFVFSGFLFLSSLTEQITFSSDSIILSATKGAAAVAVYNVGANFKGYFMTLSSSVSSVFVPKINQCVAEEKSIKVLDELFTKIGRIQFYIVSLIIIGYTSIGRAFIRLWAGEDYGDSYYIGLLLMLAVFIPLCQTLGLEIQKAMNKHKARSVVYFFIAVLNVFITIPLCRLWSGIGAAAATTICMFLGCGVFMNWYYHKKIGLDIVAFWGEIIRIIPGMIPAAGAGYFINRNCTIDSYWSVLAAAAVITVIFIASTYLFSMNKYEKDLINMPIRRILKKTTGRA